MGDSFSIYPIRSSLFEYSNDFCEEEKSTLREMIVLMQVY